MTGQAASVLDLAELRVCVSRALDRLLRVPGFRYEVTDIECVPEHSMATGGDTTVVRITVETNNRPLALGQFPGFPVGGLRGYHPNYVFGYLHGHLEARYGAEALAGVRMVLDVADRGDGTAELYRYLTVDAAVAEGLLGATGPLRELMRRYDLDDVLASGSLLSGPSYAMLRAVEQVVQRYEVSSVVDVYAGTCSLAKVACANGVLRAVCVDTGLDAQRAVRNLGGYAGRCELIPRDAASLPWRGVVDLLVVDPFYEFALDAFNDVVAKLAGRFRYLLFNLGQAEERHWMSRVLATMDALGLKQLATFSFDEIAMLCQPEPAPDTEASKSTHGS